MLSLTLQSLLFRFLVFFFAFRVSLLSWGRFSFLFQGFWGFRKEKSPCVFRSFPCFFFFKKKSKGWRVRVLSVVDRDWSARPAICVRTSRDQKKPFARNFGLIFCSLPYSSFPCFWLKGKEKSQKQTGFSIRTEPQKSLEKKGKTHTKTRKLSGLIFRSLIYILPTEADENDENGGCHSWSAPAKWGQPRRGSSSFL